MPAMSEADPSDDVRFMSLSLALGRRGLGRSWPNPAVGAVIVKDGVIIGRGWTQAGGRPHAETQALRRAGPPALRATHYLIPVPRSPSGHTAPSTDPTLPARLARLVFAMGDP